MDYAIPNAVDRRVFMKVVLVKSPKLLGGFLRLIFKVKKDNT
ncbi:MAG: stage V sporulation protein SpoVM [Clostridia bacterium]|nr:stage V sporulation protein SpoVM [Clostridia bacterium]